MTGYIPTSKFFYISLSTKISKKMTTIASYKMHDEYITRFLDILGAIIGLILSSVLFLIIPILIKLDSKGSVLYTQLRIGRNRRRRDSGRIESDLFKINSDEDRRKSIAYGKPFFVYKFRTMKDGAEKKCGPILASENDPRITRIGRILRCNYLDKLPQLINILKGDMSFVGPKPERPHLVNQFANQIPAYVERFNVRPGLTGLAQVKAGSGYDLEDVKEKLDYDLAYCKEGNLKSYFSILFLTLVQSLSLRKEIR